jgi:hypothetical protein
MPEASCLGADIIGTDRTTIPASLGGNRYLVQLTRKILRTVISDEEVAERSANATLHRWLALSDYFHQFREPHSGKDRARLGEGL